MDRKERVDKLLELRQRVLAYLLPGTWAGQLEISADLGVDPCDVGDVLEALRDEGLVTRRLGWREPPWVRVGRVYRGG